MGAKCQLEMSTSPAGAPLNSQTRAWQRNMRPIVTAAVITVVLALGAWWWTHPTSHASNTPTAAATDTAGASQGQAAAVALQQVETNPAALVPADLKDTMGASVALAVPAGTRVVADPGTWVPSTAGGGVIDAQLTYPDGTTTKVAVIMVEESDGWKVLQTVALGSTS